MFQADDRFKVSLLLFLEEIKDHYEVEVIEVKDKPLVEAQNIIVDHLLRSLHTFLLLLENDNWGFTRNHLKALLRANADVCAMSYYSRHFPYYSCNMRKVEGKTPEGGPLFAGRQEKSGYAECDLVGYGMTLYRREIFSKLEEPYFRLNQYGGPDSYATDIDFCERLRAVGVRLIGCFDYTINHRDVTPENVGELRIEGMKQGRINMLKRKGYLV